MKKYLLLSFILITVFSFTNPANAQVRVGVNINIHSRPDWGPAGYDDAEYYYLPAIESYYCVPRGQFVYLSNGRWVFSAYLPSRYSGYDLYSGYKVVVNRPYAYRYFNDDRIRYARYGSYRGRQEYRGDYYNHDHDHDRGHGNGHWKQHGRHGR